VTEHAPYQGGAFQSPPTYSGPARLLRLRAWIAMVALGLIGTKALVEAGLQAFIYPAVVRAADPDGARLAVDGLLFELVPIIGVLLLMSAGIAFVVWLHRARTNLDGPGEELSWSRGWSIGGWFLPIGNFVIPQLVVSEVGRVSQRRADEAEGRPHERRRGVVVAWVVLWSVWVAISQLGQPVLDDLDPGPSTLLSAAMSLFEAVAAGSAILLVWQVTANQERIRMAAMRYGRPAASAFPGASAPVSAVSDVPQPAFPGAPEPGAASSFPSSPESGPATG